MRGPLALLFSLALLGGGALAAPAAPLSGRVIVVDPGHGINPQGGGYTGAEGTNGVSEDANVLDIGRRLAALLRGQGATVTLTRGAYDPGPPPVAGLVARVATAERDHANIFISIHQNDSSNPGTRGVTTYFFHANSAALAADVQQQMVAVTGLGNDGTQRAPFYVLRNTTMPAILVEGGFLSNRAEATEISTPAFHQQEAAALDRAALRYFTGAAAALPPAGA